MSKKVSIRKFARTRGVSQTAVQKAIKAGRIEKEPDGSINEKTASLAWDQNTNLGKKREPIEPIIPPPPEDTKEERDSRRANRAYNMARAVREEYSSRSARLEYEQKAKSLVSASDIKMEAFQNGRIMRDTFLNLPNRISHELAAETDPDKIHTFLTKIIHETLIALFEQSKSRIMTEVEASGEQLSEDLNDHED